MFDQRTQGRRGAMRNCTAGPGASGR